MRKLLIKRITTAVLTFSLGGPAYAGNLDDALAALNRNDSPAAISLLRHSADHGDSEAEGLLGVLYRGGYGIPLDDDEGLYWLRKAAEHGNVYAQDSIGSIYYRGEGVPPDHTEAAKWWGVAAAKGDPYARDMLGHLDKEDKEDREDQQVSTRKPCPFFDAEDEEQLCDWWNDD